MRSLFGFAIALTASILLASCKTGSGSGSSTEGGSSAAGSAEGTPRTSPDLIADYEKLADDILETRKREVKIVRSILEATYEDAQQSLEDARKSLASGDNTAAKDHIEDLAMLVGYMATEGDGSVARVRKRLVEGGHHFNPLLNQPGGAGAGEAAHHGGDKAHHAGDKGHHAGDKAHHASGQPGTPQEKAHHAAGQGEQPAKEAGSAQEKAHHAGAPPHHAGGQHGEGHHGDAEGARGYDPGYVVINRGAKKALMDSNRALAKLAAAPSAAELDKEWARVEETWAKVRG